jgi:hypothetical protein
MIVGPLNTAPNVSCRTMGSGLYQQRVFPHRVGCSGLLLDDKLDSNLLPLFLSCSDSAATIASVVGSHEVGTTIATATSAL